MELPFPVLLISTPGALAYAALTFFATANPLAFAAAAAATFFDVRCPGLLVGFVVTFGAGEESAPRPALSRAVEMLCPIRTSSTSPVHMF